MILIQLEIFEQVLLLLLLWIHRGLKSRSQLF